MIFEIMMGFLSKLLFRHLLVIYKMLNVMFLMIRRRRLTKKRQSCAFFLWMVFLTYEEDKKRTYEEEDELYSSPSLDNHTFAGLDRK